MKPEINALLNSEQVKALSSKYIDEGVKKDCWAIREIEISDEVLKAHVCMTSFFVSPTDSDGFHLTIFTTQEILAQAANIYLHVFAGYSVKSMETWMRECNITCRSSVRDHENIMVELEISSIREVAGTVIAQGSARIFDEMGGLFTARLKGIMR